MIVAHAFVTAEGCVALWAEATGRDDPWPPAGTGDGAGPHGGPDPASGAGSDRSVARRARPHPFAVLPPVPLSRHETVARAGTATLVLPSIGATPLASPELSVVTARRGEPRSRPWTVPVLVLAPGTDPEWFVDELASSEQASSVRAGASIGHLADAVAFAVDLARRGRVVPTVVAGPRARWLAVLRGADLDRLDGLCRGMPGVAAAATSTVAGGWSMDATLRALLDAQVDGLVRTRLTSPLAPPRPAGAGNPRAAAVYSWLGALTGPEASFEADPTDVRQLRDHLEQWHASGATGALRTCFRLTYVEEGTGDDAPAGWLLEFLLQPVADPSVLIPAHQVFQGRAGILLRWAEYPQEVLLGDLGRASRLYPDLDDALHQPQPAELSLDVAGAYRFLAHAPMLAEAGFAVLLPARWQQRTDLGLTLTVHSADTTAAVLRDHTANLDAIVDYRWGLALGAEFLSEADLVELARAKVPLVRLRGRWVYLDGDQVAAGMAFLARGGSGQLSAGEAFRLVRLFPEQPQPLPVTGIAGSGWLADLLTGRLDERLTLVEAPATLRATLRPYQRKGLSWLAFLDRLGIGALLADDMGLGKTVQLLALEALARERGPRPPTLVVCPLSVLGNWRREIERFAPGLRVRVHHGADRELADSCDLVLTTYQLATRDVDLLRQTRWDRVVLDEAQHIKNPASATARAVRQLPARHRVALTGTPVENRLAELWSIMDFLNPGLLGPASIFRARYSVPVERFADEGAAARLRRVTRPFLLRRVKTDRDVIADLPEKFERTQWCNLTVEQATLYRAVVDELGATLRQERPGNRRKGLVLAAMTKLKQVCNHPAQLLGDGSPVPGRSGKVDRLEEILATALAEGDRALVFTQFVRLGRLLLPHLRRQLRTEVAFLHGGTARGARDAMVERFQRGDGPAVLLVSVKAGGTGLNLTAANHVVHIDRWWNPATETQATDRAFRIGQRRDVQVHRFVCVGTIEERIDRMIAEKRTMAELAVGSGEGWLTALSTEDLIDLVALAPDAVSPEALPPSSRSGAAGG